MLVLLSEAPERRLRLSELADALMFSRSRLTYQIDSMDERGMVTLEQVADGETETLGRVFRKLRERLRP